MKIKFILFTLSTAILMALCLPVMAHHGTGVSYDASKPVNMKGTVTEFRYANPHPQLFFDVKDDKGNVAHWSGEFYPNPAQLVQAGWGKKRSESVLTPGTPINIRMAPARVGGPVGAIMMLANDKGEILLGVEANSTGRGSGRWEKAMRKHLIQAGIVMAGSLALSSAAFAQGGRGGILAHNPSNDNKPYDKHDLKGVWSRNGSPLGYGGGGTCRDCGDRGFGNETPPFTPLGQKMFDANKPSYGRNLGSPEAAAHPEEHIGRRRAVPPANGSDPYQSCNPMGVTRALIYPDPVEFNVLPDRIQQQFEWGNALRVIWTDGRAPLKEPDLPRWWGYATGKWEGDTFVVDTYGFDERTWVDHFGYPHSTDMHLTERYTRTAYDVLELRMTIDDPKVYTAPWNSQLKKFRLIDQPKTLEGWRGLIEDICAPIEDVDQFNKRIRDPAGGVLH